MIPVADALRAIFDLLEVTGRQTVPIGAAAGRVLAAPLAATLDQPPFASAVMDGYAVRTEDAAEGVQLRVIGEAAAGHPSDTPVGPGEAMRIFTGAPVPAGATRVIIQEDVTRDGDTITLGTGLDAGPYIRPAGADFARGTEFAAPRLLGPSDIALLAAMGHGAVPVRKKPVVALLSTGDELVMPGTPPAEGQIIASNGLGLKALIEAAGAAVRLLPIARDTEASLAASFDLARGADLIVTIGGASVGDHDLVAKVGAAHGLKLDFYKVAMRPGKPLMAGRMNGAAMIGLPGNPVSAMVCGHVFILPALRAMLGLGQRPAPRRTARLGGALGRNGPREHYMRATVEGDQIIPATRQDSGLLSVLSGANALLIRPPHDPARDSGAVVEYTLL